MRVCVSRYAWSGGPDGRDDVLAAAGCAAVGRQERARPRLWRRLHLHEGGVLLQVVIVEAVKHGI